MSFNDYVKEYGISRAEGVLLRYLSDAYKTIVQNVPDPCWDDALIDAVGFLRSVLERVDSSLLEEWERMLSPEAGQEAAAERPAARRMIDLARDPRMLRSRIRSELHLLVRALAARDFEQAAESVRGGPDDPWTAERFEQALGPFFEQYGQLIADHRARQWQWSVIEAEQGGTWRARQVLLDPQEDNTWYLEARVDLHERDREESGEGPLLELVSVGQ